MITKTKELRETTAEQFWEDYSKLKPADRRAVAERILLDKEVSEDFIDHVLIKKAKQVKGKSVSLEEYKARLQKGKP
ncbi:MAG: hypothetical protein Q7R34_06715 [Dehalococcoidia bacterium]|nr:hypothetical protein [Dehalococcoidia bacterium]